MMIIKFIVIIKGSIIARTLLKMKSRFVAFAPPDIRNYYKAKINKAV